MKGTVYKRGKTWTIVYYIGRDESGRWKQKSEGGFPTKKEAERVLRLRIEAVETSYNSNLSCATVAGFLNYWLDNYCKQNLASNTIRGYRTNVEKHVIPHIGKIQLIKLSPKNIQDLYSKLLGSGLSSTSVRYVHNNLHKAFDYAVKLQALSRNPAEMVTPPKVSHFEASTLTPEQVVQLLEACVDKEIFWPVLLAVTLGLRRGEALALRWEDVDLDAKQVFVHHSALCTNLENFVISETKTKSSRRLLRLPDYVADVLRVRLDVLKERRKTLGESYNQLDLVCFREIGQPFTSNVLCYQFNLVLKNAGLPSIRFHDLRHTAATVMLRNAIPAKVVSAILGHSSTQLTLDTYSHVAIDMQDGAAEAIDRMLNKLC